MTNFTMITEEYINEVMTNFDKQIQEQEKAITRCRTTNGITKREKEIAEITKRKENRMKEFEDRINEMNAAKAYAGKAEYIIREAHDPWSGRTTQMQKFDTVEEIATNKKNNLERVYIVPVGTYERYKKAQAEINEIENMFR